MLMFCALVLIDLLCLCNTLPQQNAATQSQAMTTDSLNNGLAITSGMVTFFQTMLNSFTNVFSQGLPNLISLFMSPLSASDPTKAISSAVPAAIPALPSLPTKMNKSPEKDDSSDDTSDTSLKDDIETLDNDLFNE